MDKSELLNHVRNHLDAKAGKLQSLIHETRMSNNDTKSSMGDKYETGREMLQQEINHLQLQLNEILRQCESLKGIADKPSAEAGRGALVQTGKGWFYIAVSLGEIRFQEHKIFVISAESPLAMAMLGKKQGDQFSVNGISHRLLSVI